MAQRIQKILSAAGVASRRKIEQMVLDGRVRVNGKVVRQLPVLIDPAADEVEVDGSPVDVRGQEGEERLYILMHKPKGVYSTNVAQGDQVRAIDLLPDDLPGRVYPVGPLDAESTGLLLLTNDGPLTHRLTHARWGVMKTYQAQADGFVTDQTLAQLRKGVWVVDERTGRGAKTGGCEVSVIKRDAKQTVLEIKLQEGRNRQVRRMLGQLGHKVRRLARVRYGPLELRGIAPGAWRMLTEKEVRQLKRCGKEPERAAAGAD